VYTDEELVQLYIDTQRNVFFETLYERYAEKVYRKCLSLVKDTAKAEDFTHDIFLKLIVKIGSFKEDARFSTWLYSITYNYCMDQLRMNKKRAEKAIEDEMDVPDDSDIDALFQEQDLDEKRLQRSIEKLNLEERTILMMKYIDDLSIREISQIFRISESAVKMRLLRSREALRKRYLEAILGGALLLTKLVEMLVSKL
jgi:RNA polymerase sigma factor (sigma-70 family)